MTLREAQARRILWNVNYSRQPRGQAMTKRKVHWLSQIGSVPCGDVKKGEALSTIISDVTCKRCLAAFKKEGGDD